MRRMELPKPLFIISSVVLLAILYLVNAQNPDQSAFITLDCGLPAGLNYTESTTELNYVSDAPFISTGVGRRVQPEHGVAFQRQMINLRSFPEGIRNCYKINVVKGTKYLIVAAFLYGDYDNQNRRPHFDLHVGGNFWESVSIRSVSDSTLSQIIYTPQRDYVHVCLVNTRSGTPFVNTIQLRPLLNSMYEIPGSVALSRFTRKNLVSDKNGTYRYPDDVYDRGWEPVDSVYWITLTTNLTVDRESHTDYWLPAKVMRTAAMPKNKSASAAIEFHMNVESVHDRYYLYTHIAELQELREDQYRAMNIKVNGELLNGPVVPRYLSSDTFYSTKAFTGEMVYVFSIEPSQNSTLPPILNAVEIYKELDFSQSETYEDEVNTMNSIKSTYGVERNWNGDPCVPTEYTWTGLNCSFNDSPRITSLDLSSSGLTGNITQHLSELTMLESLDLSNNSLTGSVPEFFASLANLKVLNLSKNSLIGPLPAKLIERSKYGSLLLRFEGNGQSSCDSSQCGSRSKKNVIPIVASICGLVFLLLVIGAVFLLRRKKQNQGVSAVDNVSSENRKFTFTDVKKMTKNFERVLGKGGFGTVYFGLIDNTKPVAVKILSSSSGQGFREFQAEVKLLARVHHKNLTVLVGYCSELKNKALIYEYMANGNLETHLSGDTKLSWEARLQIAIDAAQGLEYLHKGCKPIIVHRDVKASNILLSKNFRAKLADFGLSRVFPTNGGTHLSTVVAGTPGYLDPEYYSTNRLNEKSDVYSFGVVLLQIITSRHPFITRSNNDRTHISDWVTAMVNNGDINSIVDKRLLGDFNINSIWRAVEISVACLSSLASSRPSMNEVVSELNECLNLEQARRNVHVMDSIEVISVNLDSDVNPSAR